MHSVGHQSDPDDGEEITSHTIPNKKLLSPETTQQLVVLICNFH